jgi:hypothetical protein
MPRRLRLPQGLIDIAKATVLPALRSFRAAQWTDPLSLDRIRAGDLVVTGFQDEVIGLGRGAQLLISALRRAGLSPVSDSIRPILDHFPRSGRRLPGKGGGVWIIVANAAECDASLQALLPSDFASRYRIAYWAWETTLAPAEWTRTARWFHEIWTPSQYVADALASRFSADGQPALCSRLRVRPHPNPRLVANPDRSWLGVAEDAFLALTTFDGRSSFARKNPKGSIEAWVSAFPEPAADRQLLIKTLPGSLTHPEWKDLALRIAERSDIRILAEQLDNEAMATLMSSIDLLVSLHRSEGFGLPIFEALSLRKAVLLTAYSAPKEFMTDEAAFWVPAREVPVSDPSRTYVTGCWGEPDLEVAAMKLRDLFDHHRHWTLPIEAGAHTAERLDQDWSMAALDAQPWRSFVS